jgi:hypothetical protein
MFHSLRTPGAIPLPPITAEQWVTDSPAPAGPVGLWEACAPVPRGANHTPVVTLGETICALGGMLE